MVARQPFSPQSHFTCTIPHALIRLTGSHGLAVGSGFEYFLCGVGSACIGFSIYCLFSVVAAKTAIALVASERNISSLCCPAKRSTVTTDCRDLTGS